MYAVCEHIKHERFPSTPIATRVRQTLTRRVEFLVTHCSLPIMSIDEKDLYKRLILGNFLALDTCRFLC